MSEWTALLRPASFRGVPFGVIADERTTGRRVALHEYPDRDTAFAEDMGRATPVLTMQGFLIGADAIRQRERLEAAAEAPGPGALVHPTKGRLQANLRLLSIEERWDQGRYFELKLEFVEATEGLFPTISVSTLGAVLSAATAATGAVGQSFLALIDGAGSAGAVSQEVTAEASLAASRALSVVENASSLFGGDASDVRSASASLATAAAGLSRPGEGPATLVSASFALASAVRTASRDPAAALQRSIRFLGLFG